MARVDGTEQPDAQGADDRAPGGADGNAVASVGSTDEVTRLRRELSRTNTVLSEIYAAVWPDEVDLTGRLERRLLEMPLRVGVHRPTTLEARTYAYGLTSAVTPLLESLHARLLAAQEQGMLEHERAVEQGNAWKEDAERRVAELELIRKRLRELGDGAQYDDITNVRAIEMIAEQRDSYLSGWGRCHRRHLDLERGRETRPPTAVDAEQATCDACRVGDCDNCTGCVGIACG